MQSRRGRLSSLRKSPHGEEAFDSLLEMEYMNELEHDPAVASWTKRHGIRIPYRLFGFQHHYHPDFLVTYKDGSKALHETKGLPLLFWLSTRLKRESAEEHCRKLGWEYRLITKGLR